MAIVIVHKAIIILFVFAPLLLISIYNVAWEPYSTGNPFDVVSSIYAQTPVDMLSEPSSPPRASQLSSKLLAVPGAWALVVIGVLLLCSVIRCYVRQDVP